LKCNPNFGPQPVTSVARSTPPKEPFSNWATDHLEPEEARLSKESRTDQANPIDEVKPVPDPRPSSPRRGSVVQGLSAFPATSDHIAAAADEGKSAKESSAIEEDDGTD
jgi:hypothetical protein